MIQEACEQTLVMSYLLEYTELRAVCNTWFFDPFVALAERELFVIC